MFLSDQMESAYSTEQNDKAELEALKQASSFEQQYVAVVHPTLC